ncbi:MAG: hypothetical protein KC729_07280, partial [Candidatus Eisenbacteria bacterium]|nr:hypothetical protein [Candidatus Eisenbacteria bacterium]
MFGLLVVSSAFGGPNAGGVIILHQNDALVYTDGVSFCGQAGLNVCDNAATRADTDEIVVLHALAAFPGDAHPRLAGIAFGVHYDEAQIRFVDWGMCGDFELSESGWPASDSGTAVTWGEAQTNHLTQFYWIAAYSYLGNPAQVVLRGHPQGGGNFADDDIPSNLDVIADYGAFGFYMDGELPCPVPQPGTTTLALVPSEITVYQPCGSSFGIDLHVNDVYSLAAFEI